MPDDPAPILSLIQAAGYAVEAIITTDAAVLTATKGGHVFVARGTPDDVYRLACELAVLCGFDLE